MNADTWPPDLQEKAELALRSAMDRGLVQAEPLELPPVEHRLATGKPMTAHYYPAVLCNASRQEVAALVAVQCSSTNQKQLLVQLVERLLDVRSPHCLVAHERWGAPPPEVTLILLLHAANPKSDNHTIPLSRLVNRRAHRYPDVRLVAWSSKELWQPVVEALQHSQESRVTLVGQQVPVGLALIPRVESQDPLARWLAMRPSTEAAMLLTGQGVNGVLDVAYFRRVDTHRQLEDVEVSAEEEEGQDYDDSDTEQQEP